MMTMAGTCARRAAALLLAIAWTATIAAAQAVVLIPPGASPAVQLAGREVRRYLYLTTGTLPALGTWTKGGRIPAAPVILVNASDGPGRLPGGVRIPEAAARLLHEEYFIGTVPAGKAGNLHLVIGGDSAGLLYGAYAFAEALGVRFYLDGDVVPDRRIAPERIRVAPKRGSPLFAIRGIQPFHDFPEGPDWWTRDDYKAVLAQCAKLKMNFAGFHAYPEGGVGPEPLVWIGVREDIRPDGSVAAAYPARHFTNANGTWGYPRRLTESYANRIGDLFECDVFGTSYMKGIDGWPGGPGPERALFDSAGAFFGDVFSFAHDVGVMTCVGTETPLVVPARVRERIAPAVADSAAAERLYEGMFTWVARHYRADYYWFWTPEDWTWRENTPAELANTMADLRAAMRAAQEVRAPFTLATCGWVLGPHGDRALFDRVLPKSWPMSCINRYVGFEPIDDGFARTTGRPLWAIPWLEDDPGLSVPQLWAGRVRRDAADAAAYGCTGLVGIHWRTRMLGPNISALAQAAWEQPWNPALGRRATPAEAVDRRKTMNLDGPVTEFYRDWARAGFGGDPADSIAAIIARLDGGPVFVPNSRYGTWIPRPADWIDGPGGIRADTLTWAERSGSYAFVGRLERCMKGIGTPGSRARADYWLGVFRYLRAAGKFSCTLGEIARLADTASHMAAAERAGLWVKFVALRQRQIGDLRDVYMHLLETLSTRGEMGTIANWQQHIRDVALERPGARIELLMGRKLPPECWPDTALLAVRKMVIPTVRTSLRRGEPFTLEARFYGHAPETVTLRRRTLGAESFDAADFTRAGRNVYTISLPPSAISDDFEYYVEAHGAQSGNFLFPSTAPLMYQTVVVF